MIFQPIYKAIITFSGLSGTISECESKGLSNEKFTPPFTSNESLSSKLVWIKNSRIKLEFKGSCLKQDKAPFPPNNVVKLYTVYELNTWSQELSAEFTRKDCLFGAVKVTKNATPNKYSYSGYGIEFDSRSLFSISNIDWGKNAIIFGFDMSSSVHANNKNKDILILGKGQTKGLDNTSLTSVAEYFINFLKIRKRICLHYNGSNRFLFFNGTKIHQFKAKDSEIKRYPLCLGNTSKDFSVDNMKKTGLNRYVYDFSVDYNIIDTSNIIDSHKYLMKNHDIK